MAQKATIYKATIQLSDLDRDHYDSYSLTIACHPSENEARMMVRLLAFALNASDRLSFTQGLCVDDEPELWQKSFADEIELWIDLGQADESRIKKACSRSERVILYTYQPRSANVWWDRLGSKLSRYDNLTVYALTEDDVVALTSLCHRTMQITCLIQDGQVWLSDDNRSVSLVPRQLTN